MGGKTAASAHQNRVNEAGNGAWGLAGCDNKKKRGYQIKLGVHVAVLSETGKQPV